MRLHTLERRVLNTIQQHALIPPDSTVIVAVSGGVDSMALMHILHALAPKLRCTLHVATVDHMLRGEESAADAQFVADEAAKLGLACTVEKRDVEALRKGWRMGVETAARRARYEFLADVALRVGAECVTTAHHADDQVETILMRLGRGAALRGLAGMRLFAPLPHAQTERVTLIRPLLDVRKENLLAFMTERMHLWREDATNAQDDILRNQMRRLLAEMPHLHTHLIQLSELAQMDEDYFSSLIIHDGKVPFRQDGKRITFKREHFRQYHPALQLRFVAGAFDILATDVEFAYTHHRRCQDAIAHGQAGKRVQFPGYWSLHITVDEATLEAWAGSAPSAAERTQSSVILLGDPNIPVCTLIVPRSAAAIMRGRRNGDRFAPPGLDGHTQKIKQWMIDRKIPAAIRDRIPLIDLDGQIAAIFWDGKWTVAEPFSAHRPPNDDEHEIVVALYT